MRGWRIGVAVLGVAGMMLGVGAPAGAATQSGVGSSKVQATVYAQRMLACTSPDYCNGVVTVPRAWRQVKTARWQDRFVDPSAPRMIRFDLDQQHRITPAAAMKKREAALRGTPGLKVLGRATSTLTTARGGKVRMATLVYTYRSGSTTRWVANRFVSLYDIPDQAVELTVAGRLADKAVLTTTLAQATRTFTLVG
ncbi:hypothetical protein OHA70_22940 [Kribbella sp. NBC_00382]|uniref:hypothetical protein n=1 Tax=Kribbella sp. NBC_00382 TaxID=2975967 RepID=UPI002E1DCF73